MKFKLLLFQALFLCCAWCLSVSLNSAVSTPYEQTSKQTTYKISIFLADITGGEIPAGSYFTIQFPSDYPLSNLASVTGANSDGSPPIYTFSSSGRTFSLRDAFPVNSTDSMVIEYDLIGVVNPNRVMTTQPFVISLISDTNSVISSDSSQTINIIPGAMTCLMSPYSLTQVEAVSQLIVTVTPSTAIPSDGYLTMDFPYFWPNDMIKESTRKVLNPNIYCSNNTNTVGTLSCSVSSLQATIINLFGSEMSSQFKFRIQPITNPRTEYPVGGVTIKSFDSSGVQIDECYPVLSGVTAATLTSVSFYMASNNTSTSSTASIRFTTSKMLQPNDRLKVVFPTGFSLNQLLSSFLFVGSNTSSCSIFSKSGQTVVINITLNSNQAASSLMLFTFNNLITPPSALQTPNIDISTMRSGYAIETVSCCPFTAVPASLTATVTADSLLAGSTTAYTFTLITSSFLSSTAYIYIMFPAEYSLTTSSSSCLSSSGVNVSMSSTCAITAPRRLLVTNLLSGSLSASSTIVIKAGSISNPSFAMTTSTFTISTFYSSSDGLVDTNTAVTLQIQASTINSVTVTPNNSVVYASASYTFLINNTNSLNSGSFLQIVFPSDIQLGTLQCFVNTTIAVQCTKISSTTINVTSIINSTVGVSQLINSPLLITGITNPQSVKPTSSISITIYTSTYIAIEQRSTGISITMSTAASFLSPSASPGSPLTGNSNSYSFQLTSPFVLPNNTNLTISLPTEYQLSLTSCTPTLNLLALSCNNTANMVTLLLPVSSSTVSSVRFSVSSIRNPISQATPAAITIRLYISTYLSLYGTLSLGPYTPNSITYTATQTSHYMAETTSLSMTVTTSNLIPPNSYLSSPGTLAITIPNEYTASSIGCESVVGITNFLCSFSSGILRITGNSFQTSITLSLSGLTNPNVSLSSQFSLISYDSNNNVIDVSTTNYKYVAPCTIPCRSCTTTLSQCLSCYTASAVQSTVSNRKYLSLSQCEISCNSTAYADTDMICRACSVNCSACSLQPDNCTSCPVGRPYMLNNVCYIQCPTKYYNDSSLGQCVSCPVLCQTCTSSTVCQSCIATYFLKDNSCISACPPIFYSENGVCIACSTNCTVCDATGCQACQSGSYLFAGQCYTQCPTGYYISTSTCVACSSQCLSCLTYYNNCSSCVSSSSIPNLYQGQCLNACPAGYYSESGVCTLCILPCTYCTSRLVCTKCQSGNLLYNGSCGYTYCPGNTIQVATSCLSCTPPCLTCSGSPTFCTSCIYSLFLDTGNCVSTCTLPYFGILGKCVTCAYPCSTCVSLQPYNCTACISGYLLLGNVCYTSCPTGTYASMTYGKCQVCNTACTTCTSSSFCTSCAQGMFLYNNFCYANCPPLYYAYQSLCLLCQSQCTSCLNSPVACVTCSSSLYLHNTETLACTLTCDIGYYQNASYCIPCQLPCKTCDTVFNSCSSCYNGLYLYNGTCLSSCPTGHYTLHSNNTCLACTFPCLQCTQFSCLVCDPSSAYYSGSCYVDCPAEAPYNLTGYCTNCTSIGYCVQCLSDKCSSCVTPYLLYSGGCVATCPNNYQPDILNSSCVRTAAYLDYLDSIEQDRRKNLPFPFTILLFCFGMTLILSKCQNKQTYYLGSLISFSGLMEFGSWILLLVFLHIYPPTLWWLPILVYVLMALNFVFNILNLVVVITVFRKDSSYVRWLAEGNTNKYKVILAVSVILTYKFSRSLFCRYFDLPMFSARLLGIDKFHWWNRITCISMLFIQALAITIAALAAFNYPLYYTKVFLASIETAFFGLLLLCLQLADLRKHEYDFFKQPSEDPLKDASKDKMKAYSYWMIEEQDSNRISRTKSEGKIETEKNLMRSIEDDYISVYDPDDYQDVPKVANNKIERGIEKGKFRRKNKKRLYDLWEIAEISSDSSSYGRSKKKKRKNGPTGFLNNYIYWKPPTNKIKVQPKKKEPELSEFDEDRIFYTIRNKYSEFDLMSKHEDLYVESAQRTRYGKYQELEQPENSKMSIDVSCSYEQLGPQLNSFTFTFEPDDLMNLNYAKKKHIEKEKPDQRLLPNSDTQRQFTRIGGMIVKNHKH